VISDAQVARRSASREYVLEEPLHWRGHTATVGGSANDQRIGHPKPLHQCFAPLVAFSVHQCFDYLEVVPSERLGPGSLRYRLLPACGAIAFLLLIGNTATAQSASGTITGRVLWGNCIRAIRLPVRNRHVITSAYGVHRKSGGRSWDRRRYETLGGAVDERVRRLFVATESLAIGRGGQVAVSRATACREPPLSRVSVNSVGLSYGR
jgi:hypothetical protein